MSLYSQCTVEKKEQTTQSYTMAKRKMRKGQTTIYKTYT